MKEKIIKIIPVIEKTNSTFGKYKISVLIEYTYNTGKKQNINSNLYFFKKVEAEKFLIKERRLI